MIWRDFCQVKEKAIAGAVLPVKHSRKDRLIVEIVHRPLEFGKQERWIKEDESYSICHYIGGHVSFYISLNQWFLTFLMLRHFLML